MTGKVYAALFLLSALVLVLCEWYWQSSTDILIENPSRAASSIQMSRKEAKQLECLFRELIISDLFAYTLAGCKPMSFACYREPGLSLFTFFPHNLKVHRGWQVWEKYRTYLENDRLRFWREKSPWVEDVFCLIIANMDQCDEMMIKHAADFQNIMEQKAVNASDLFQEIHKTPFLQNTINKHDVLLGILLGFGRENAWLYHEKFNNPGFTKHSTAMGPVIDQNRSNYFAMQRSNISDMLLPVFIGDPNSEESKLLEAKYKDASKKIIKFYEDRDFLSATLSLYKYGNAILCEH